MKQNGLLFLLLLIVVLFIVAICLSCKKSDKNGEGFTLHTGPASYAQLHSNDSIPPGQFGNRQSGPGNKLFAGVKLVARSPVAKIAHMVAAQTIGVATTEGEKAGLHAVAVGVSKKEMSKIAADAKRTFPPAEVEAGIGKAVAATVNAQAATEQAVAQKTGNAPAVKAGSDNAMLVKALTEKAHQLHHTAAVTAGSEAPITKKIADIKKIVDTVKVNTKTGSTTEAVKHATIVAATAKAVAGSPGVSPQLAQHLAQLAQLADRVAASSAAAPVSGPAKTAFNAGQKIPAIVKKAVKVAAAQAAGTPISGHGNANPKHRQGDNLENQLDSHSTGSVNPVNKGKIDFSGKQREKILRGGTASSTLYREPRKSAGSFEPTTETHKNHLIRHGYGPQNAKVLHLAQLLKERSSHYGQSKCSLNDPECLAAEAEGRQCAACQGANNTAVNNEWKNAFDVKTNWTYDYWPTNPLAGHQGDFAGAYDSEVLSPGYGPM